MATQITDELGGIPLEVDLFLLICSMFPLAKKDHFRIPIEDIILYGMGLKLFEDVNDMFEARDRVHGLIDFIDYNHPYKIKKIEYDNQHVKMQVSADDLVSLASRYQLVFSHDTIFEKWPNKSIRYKDCYGLSLVLRRMSEYFVNLECPRLALLLLQYEEDSKSLPAHFFEGMKGLLVLSLDVPSLPQSLNVLKNLQTLRLKLMKSDDLSVIGGLINLEFFSICTVSLTDIPREMGELDNLRLLDLSKMNLAYIPPGVLSKMLKLEELYLPVCFRGWGCNAKEENCDYHGLKSREDFDDGERINASLGEIGSLSLKVLQISAPNISIFPKNSSALKNIWRFKILVPCNLKSQLINQGFMNELRLRGDACDIEDSGICDLMTTTEVLSLTRVRNLKSVNYVIYQTKDSDLLHVQLKRMIISECDELECFFDASGISNTIFISFWRLRSLHLSMLSNLRELVHGRVWFANLRQINISFCHKLKYVFPTSMVNELRTLQSIQILDCSEMEGIFRNEVDQSTYGVYCIEELLLYSLPNLIGFLVFKDNTVDAVNDGTNQSLTTNELSPIKDTDAVSHTKMYSAFSSESSLRLKSLKKLKIAFCDALKVIFSFKKEHVWLSRLHNSSEELELCGLRNLVHNMV